VIIEISRGDQGKPTVEPRHAEVKRDEKVEFRLKGPAGDADSFQVIFNDHEAFDRQQVSGQGNASREVNPNKKGTFDYMVIARIGGEEFEDLHCPSIHVS
jgi:hypothetical protein